LDQLTDAQFSQIHPALTSDVRKVLNVKSAVASRSSSLGTASASVGKAIADLDKQISSVEGEISNHRKLLSGMISQ